MAESVIVKDLKTQLKILKNVVNEIKEIKFLFDMYKGINKKQWDKVQLMKNVKRKQNWRSFWQQVKKIQETRGT